MGSFLQFYKGKGRFGKPVLRPSVRQLISALVPPGSVGEIASCDIFLERMAF